MSATYTPTPPRRRIAAPKRRNPVSWVMRWLIGLALVVALVAPVFAAARVVVASVGDDRRDSDAVVVLGAAQYDGTPSPVFAARLDHAAELLADGVAPAVVTIGGRQPGDRHTEADAGRNYLVARGVDAGSVTALGAGHDTVGSLRAVARYAKRQGWSSITVVSDPAHVARAGAVAERFGFGVRLSPTQDGPGSALTGHYVAREAVGLLLFETVQRWDTPRLLD